MAKHIRYIQYNGQSLAADAKHEISIVGYGGKNPTPDFFPWNPYSGEKTANCQLVIYLHPVGSASQSGRHTGKMVIPRSGTFEIVSMPIWA